MVRPADVEALKQLALLGGLEDQVELASGEANINTPRSIRSDLAEASTQEDTETPREPEPAPEPKPEPKPKPEAESKPEPEPKPLY